MDEAERQIVLGHLELIGGILNELQPSSSNVAQEVVVLSKAGFEERLKAMRLSVWAVEDVVKHSEECECYEEPPCW